MENELKEKIKKEKNEVKIKVTIKNEQKFKEKLKKEKELKEKESKENELKEMQKKEKEDSKKNSDIIVKTQFKNISSPNLLIEQSKKENNNKKSKDRIKINLLFFQKNNDVKPKKKRFLSHSNIILKNDILDERKNE